MAPSFPRSDMSPRIRKLHSQNQGHGQFPSPSSSSSSSSLAPSSSSSSSSSSCPAKCEQSAAATLDIVILVLVVGACAFLFTPCFRCACGGVAEILPAALALVGEAARRVPRAYLAGAAILFSAALAGLLGLELCQSRARRCRNPRCRGLRRALDFDIQLDTEEVVRSNPGITSVDGFPPPRTIELGDDHKELEAELRRMAPPNGRAVLIFRSPCGCPTARLEVWGYKKPRKSKK